MKNAEIAIIDAETDPFVADRVPRPFVFGYFDGNDFLPWWGENCVHLVVDCIRRRRPKIVFAHNGGKFDFIYLIDELQGKIRIINSRIAQARIGTTEIRDSWCILPFPLAKFDKGKINYEIFERERRERPQNKRRILTYLERDCRSLYALVDAFRVRFGKRLTIASSAMAEVRSKHPFPNTSPRHDARFRPFYFGGRVQCFETGRLRGHFKLYDLNSSYPNAMANFWHPCGEDYDEFDETEFYKYVEPYRDWPWFACVSGNSLGCFPRRAKDGRLEFRTENAEFFVSSHEYYAAIDCGLFEGRIRKVWRCNDRIRFSEFVHHLYGERFEHKASGNLALELATKYGLNSPYGKFAQNPENYADYYIRRAGFDIPGEHFHLGHAYCDWPAWRVHTDYGDRGELWTRPVPPDGCRFFDVAIAASITGAARGVLMRAIHAARRPIYCDTDSIICEQIPAEFIGDGLGQWKLEAEGTQAFIVAKKLYSIWRGNKFIKSGAKGIQKNDLTKRDWIDLIEGAEIESANPAPNFKLDGSARFTKRKVRYVK